MARIVLGMAVPHSGLLGKPPETWLEDGERDRKNNALWYHNKTWRYEDLEQERRADNIRALITVEERRTRSERCRDALDTMRSIYRESKPDIVVILGKDQREIFVETMPSLAIYTGATIENGPPQRSVYAPENGVTYPGSPELALYLIEALERDGFDLVEISKWPPNVWLKQATIVPHAYGFVYHQIMGDQPPPSVPIFMNTFYPPTQPSIGRSIAFGKSLFAAIRSWPSEKTVAIIGSGGLTHFVCDEQLDRLFLDCFSTCDLDRLAEVDERSYQSGTSEVKLFVPILIAMSELRFEMKLVDYVPCYRTEAGTGEGMGFIYWKS
jgi:hypothetical protein